MLCINGIAFGEENTKAVVIDRMVNIYENPQGNSKAVGSAGAGDTLFVIGNEGKWLKISTENGIHGWIHSQSVLITDYSKHPIKEGVANEDCIYVYELPDPNSLLKGALGFTSKVSIVAQKEKWLHIAVGDEVVGWVPAQHITVAATPVYPKAMIVSDKTNVKVKPEYNSETMVEIEKNTIVLLKDYKADYFHVILTDGQEGWIHKYQMKTVHEIIEEKNKSYFTKHVVPSEEKNKNENKSGAAEDDFEDIKKAATLIGKDFTATAYDLSIASCGKAVGAKNRGFTSTGIDLNGKQWGDIMVVSVDSKVIPLGSKILVLFKADDWRSKYNGIYIAGDTGGGVKARTIDIYLGDNGNKQLEEVKKFGRGKDVEVYLID
ncbi:3D (Asp-Asp-Asp) domain-containing protein [Geosporobacter subterraneus DSM 17957]|uniref:3D (Asp-Asp-Asp) domain-containing protein n=1 Tax=Geosporobacter subterraneus DSM 17957 TaxID=1121919 RepID=A0A1M6P533_9FIRM|nr:SH3 domain-containing protein [Geosporobacter subterraneus]SHK03013.1 3D (Asp-Asp-Asp) domain-containing protein [Geosporobacter subterraneus DSM 17957]